MDGTNQPKVFRPRLSEKFRAVLHDMHNHEQFLQLTVAVVVLCLLLCFYPRFFMHSVLVFYRSFCILCFCLVLFQLLGGVSNQSFSCDVLTRTVSDVSLLVLDSECMLLCILL